MPIHVLFVNDYSLEKTLHSVQNGRDNSAHLWGYDYLAKAERASHAKIHERFLSLQKKIHLDKLIGGIYEQADIFKKRKKADVIVAANINMVWGLGALSRRMVLPPIIGILHSLPRYHHFLYHTFLRGHLAGIRKIACIARKDFTYLKDEVRIPSDRLEMLPWAVNPSDFDLPETPRPSQRPYIVSIGKSKRDYATLLSAFEDSAFDAVDLRIHCADAKLGVAPEQKNVRVHRDFMPFSDCVAEYRHSEFIVIPLVASDRTLGLTSLYDALGTGKAFVMSRNVGVDIDIEKEKMGLWVAPQNAKDLRAKMLFFLRNPETAREYGENARRWLETKYNYGHFCRKLHDLVKEVHEHPTV